MAIITENTNSNPMAKAVFSFSQDTPIVSLPEVGPQIDFCTCDYECEYINYVFADLTSTEDFKNDKSSFLIGLSDNSSTLDIVLIDSSGNETIINDNTLGEYFAKGSFDKTANQTNYAGFIADWKKILTIKGAGQYYFRFTETTFGEEFVTESVKYQLLPYNENIVYKTIRFKFIQNGLIESGLDYRGLNWEIQVRIKGKVNKLPSILEKDTYFTPQRKKTQIQSKKIKAFEIETGLIPESIGGLIEENTLANDILITNYDWFAYEKLVDFSVDITEISDFKGNYKLNSLGSFVFAAEERTQNTVKRNV